MVRAKMPAPPHSMPDALPAMARKLRTALALYETGIALQRARLRDHDPSASEEEISARLAAWLRTRPGAPLGDAEGTGRAFPDSD